MGSVVKSIGRVFKGIGKTLKKIAPVLLVAAAVYVGYGFATGFAGAGWPTITGWGKSLMSGVSSGSTVSQAASQATQAASGATPVMETAAQTAEAVSQAAAPSALETAAGAQQSGVTGGLLNSIGGGGPDSGSMAFNAFFPEAYAGDASVMTDIRGSLLPGTDAEIIAFDEAARIAEQGASGYTGFPDLSAQGTADLLAFDQFGAGSVSSSSYVPPLGGGGADAGSMSVNAFTPQKAIANFGALGKDAWNWYKKLWKDNPLIALMTTNQVVSLIADAMEKEKTTKEFGGMSNEEYRNVVANAPSLNTNVAQVQSRYGRGPKAGPIGGRPSTMPAQPQVARQYASPMSKQGQGLIGSRPQERLA